MGRDITALAIAVLVGTLIASVPAYFGSGWIGRRMKVGTHPAVPYGLTWLVMAGFVQIDGIGGLSGFAVPAACLVAILLAEGDRRRRGITVFDEDDVFARKASQTEAAGTDRQRNRARVSTGSDTSGNVMR